MYQKAYEKKDINNIVNINYDNAIRNANALYKNKDKINDLWEEYNENVNTEDKEFQPLKNYELVFYGEGKIATFKHSSGLDIDSRLRGTSALYFLYDDQSMAYFPGLYLYMDKDKYNDKEEDLQLEMIK
ncbi:hypothetical protein PJJ26_00030 (plasmid) [Tenacibaculum finnmarkense]|nr:hypothetical protein PJJ26_00030 [Tenacibaculum finnmarkense]